MKKYTQYIGTIMILFLPIVVGAQGAQGAITGETCEGFSCGYANLIRVIQDIILFLFKLSVPIAAIALAVAGFKILTARDNAGARTDAKEMMLKIVGGVMLMLAAGLIVNTILGALLKPEYIFVN